MEVSVLRKNGKVVLLETTSDVVDALTSILKKPVGAVAALTDGSAFSDMQDSVDKLRDGIFVDNKKPKKIEKLDVEAMVEGKEQQTQGRRGVGPRFGEFGRGVGRCYVGFWWGVEQAVYSGMTE